MTRFNEGFMLPVVEVAAIVFHFILVLGSVVLAIGLSMADVVARLFTVVVQVTMSLLIVRVFAVHVAQLATVEGLMMLLVHGLLDYEVKRHMVLMILVFVAASNIEMVVVLTSALVLGMLVGSLLHINKVVLWSLMVMVVGLLMAMLVSKSAALLEV